MRSILCVVAFVSSATFFAASTVDASSPKSIDELSTHHQSAVIEIDDDSDMKINAFCLDAKGHIVAAVGNGPGGVRVVDDSGKVLATWNLDIKPESINVTDSGDILVGGEGKLYRFSDKGALLQEATSPHAERLKNSKEALRKMAIQNLERRRHPYRSQIQSYESIIAQLEERAKTTELNANEKQTLEILPNTLERIKEMQKARNLAAGGDEEEDEEKGPSEQEIESQIASLMKSKMRISSISSSGDKVFVTTRGVEGYGYDVWKTDTKFTSSEVIITGLRGCCGQMDVQCCEQGIFVAENSADRVVHYDFDGKEIIHWGKSDRTGIDGFASCCNPMNVCFDQKGYVYTAEASVGRIKQFDSEGKLIAYIGDVDLVPGCKNVSIAVSPVSDSIYMLDLTRNHIKMMKPKPPEAEGDDEAPAEAAPDAAAEQASITKALLSLFTNELSK